MAANGNKGVKRLASVLFMTARTKAGYFEPDFFTIIPFQLKGPLLHLIKAKRQPEILSRSKPVNNKVKIDKKWRRIPVLKPETVNLAYHAADEQISIVLIL